MTTTYGYDAANQIATINGSAAGIGHDAAGNITSMPGGYSATYDGQGNTASVTVGGTTTPMGYGDDRQPVRTQVGTVTQTPTILGVTDEVDAGDPVAYLREPDGALLARRHPVDGDAYYLFDDLGSVLALTDDTGAVVNSYTYGPYGEPQTVSQTVEQPWRYVGRHGYHTDPTGLVKAGHRYYSPDLGRWTQPDPSARELNPYAYSGCTPVNGIDPTGLDWRDEVAYWSYRYSYAVLCTAVGIAATPIAGGACGIAFEAFGRYVIGF